MIMKKFVFLPPEVFDSRLQRPQALAIGPVAYLVAGRNKPKRGKGPKRRIIPPDDDPDFLRKL